MTSAAVASSESGTLRSSALAVVRLMMRSNLVGCSTECQLALLRAEPYRHNHPHAGIGRDSHQPPSSAGFAFVGRAINWPGSRVTMQTLT